LVEHSTENAGVVGSIPIITTKALFAKRREGFLFMVVSAPVDLSAGGPVAAD
jgi:hypothetical protein